MKSFYANALPTKKSPTKVGKNVSTRYLVAETAVASFHDDQSGLFPVE